MSDDDVEFHSVNGISIDQFHVIENTSIGYGRLDGDGGEEFDYPTHLLFEFLTAEGSFNFALNLEDGHMEQFMETLQRVIEILYRGS